MAILTKNGTVVTASETFQADILIENEIISQIGKNPQHPGAGIIDASGRCSPRSHWITGNVINVDGGEEIVA